MGFHCLLFEDGLLSPASVEERHDDLGCKRTCENGCSLIIELHFRHRDDDKNSFSSVRRAFVRSDADDLENQKGMVGGDFQCRDKRWVA